jgi:hypothetical protein
LSGIGDRSVFKKIPNRRLDPEINSVWSRFEPNRPINLGKDEPRNEARMEGDLGGVTVMACTW